MLHSIIKPILRPITRSSIQFPTAEDNQDTLVNNKKTVFAFVNKDNLIDLCSRKGVVIAYDDTHKVAKVSKIKLCTAWFFYDDMKKRNLFIGYLGSVSEESIEVVLGLVRDKYKEMKLTFPTVLCILTDLACQFLN